MHIKDLRLESEFLQEYALMVHMYVSRAAGGRGRRRMKRLRAQPAGALFAPVQSPSLGAAAQSSALARHGRGQHDAELRIQRIQLQCHRQLFVARRGRSVDRTAILLVPIQGRRHFFPGHRPCHRRSRQRHGRRRRQTHAEHALANKLLPRELHTLNF